jgi:hypothetical protein
VKIIVPMADVVQDMRSQTFIFEVPDRGAAELAAEEGIVVVRFGEDTDKDIVAVVDRYGNEMHLTRDVLSEIVLALDDNLDMLRADPDGATSALVGQLEPVQAWLEQAEQFGRTPLTDPDNMQMTIVEDGS